MATAHERARGTGGAGEGRRATLRDGSDATGSRKGGGCLARTDARKQEDDDERVEDGEPVDLIITHVEVQVPPRGPRNVRVLPNDVVGEDDLGRPRWHRRQVGAQRDAGELRLLCIPRTLVRVLHRVGLYLEADDASAGEGLRLVILDNEAKVVVHIRLARLGARDILGADEAEAEAAVVPASGSAHVSPSACGRHLHKGCGAYMSFLVPSGISAIILVAAGRLSMIMWTR